MMMAMAPSPMTLMVFKHLKIQGYLQENGLKLLKAKADANKTAADTKAAAAAKAYQDGDKGALPDYTKNKDAITNFSAKVAKAKVMPESA